MSKRRRGRSVDIGKEIGLSLNQNAYSKQLDSFKGYEDVIKPPHNPALLFAITEQSDSLKQMYNAYAVNIAGFGWGIRHKESFDYNKADEATQKTADEETRRLQLIYKYINPKESFGDVIEKVLYDRELMGFGCAEILRNTLGEVAQIEYCQAANIRICNNKDTTAEVLQWQEDLNGNKIQVPVMRKFKKFVQKINDKKVYFKEFGDPRNLNCTTGVYDENTIPEKLATELAFFSVHDGYSKYGSPRWIGTSINVSGSIMSEKLNYDYFKRGRIMASAIMVSGGQLTEESVRVLKNTKGIDHSFGMMLIEAEAFPKDESATLLDKSANASQVKVDIKSLVDSNNNDALFQNYQKDNKDKVRDTFKLPPIYTGATSDYTRATADTARDTAEDQIFRPERRKIANVFNTIINNELGINYCELYFVNPEISNASDLASILAPFINAGAVTPNMMLDIFNGTVNRKFAPLPDSIGDLPFDLVKIKFQQRLQDEMADEEEETMLKALTDMSESIQKALVD